MSKFSPPINRSMRVLDKAFFNKDVALLVASFPDPKHLGQFVKLCKDDILYKPSIKHIVEISTPTNTSDVVSANDTNDAAGTTSSEASEASESARSARSAPAKSNTTRTRGVLLREDVDDITTYKDKLSPNTLAKIEEYGVKLFPYTMKLTYDFWKSDDILGAILPEHLLSEIPGGFAQAGHIAHLNLKDEFKPYDELIGQVILDKNPKIETVVDKIDSIGNQFRTFQMKVLAGRDDFLVEQSESGCKFKFDFSKVYWNSRLSTEHDRLIEVFKPQEVVGDVFAGVGPFAVPAGKKNVLVLANDLNPESYKYLQENISLNHVSDFVRPFNLDGREFIRQSPKLLLEWSQNAKVIEKKKVVKKRKVNPETKEVHVSRDQQVTSIPIPSFFSNYVMNLPDTALTFLNEFVGLYSRDPEVEQVATSNPDFRLPTIHAHCFEKYSPSEQPEPSLEVLHERVLGRINGLLGYELALSDCQFHLVRRVAPTKPMFCVSFVLPREVAFRKVD